MPATNIDKLYLGDILLCGGTSTPSASIGFSVSTYIDVVSTQIISNPIQYDQYLVMANSGIIETDL